MKLFITAAGMIFLFLWIFLHLLQADRYNN